MGGNPIGHIVPGTALLCLALYLLFVQVSLHRGKYSKSRLILLGGLGYTALACVGMGVEIYGGAQYGRPFQAKEHITMYALFAFAGGIHVSEAVGRLPDETWRASLGLAMLGVGLLFFVHSQMQLMEEHNPVESFVHWLLAMNYFATASCFFLSWGLEQWRSGFLLTAVAGVLHQTFWFYFLADVLYSGEYGDMGMHLPMGDATAYFVWDFILALGIVTIFECRFRTTTLPSAGARSIHYSKVVDERGGLDMA